MPKKQPATNNATKKRSGATNKNAAKTTTPRAKYPRHSVERALRIPRAIMEQNAGRACTPDEAASYLGVASSAGPFAVEVGSGIKYGFLQRPEEGKIRRPI